MSTFPLLATPSNSISFALRMNLDTTTGWSGLTTAAPARHCLSCSSSEATFMAAPERTYEGRTSTG